MSLQLTTKVPATNSVQGVEASLAELLTKILPRFSTVFSTKVLKSGTDLSEAFPLCAMVAFADARGRPKN
jgi:hypothetical protein